MSTCAYADTHGGINRTLFAFVIVILLLDFGAISLIGYAVSRNVVHPLYIHKEYGILQSLSSHRHTNIQRKPMRLTVINTAIKMSFCHAET